MIDPGEGMVENRSRKRSARGGSKRVSRWSGVSRWSDRRIVANFRTMAGLSRKKKKCFDCCDIAFLKFREKLSCFEKGSVFMVKIGPKSQRILQNKYAIVMLLSLVSKKNITGLIQVRVWSKTAQGKKRKRRQQEGFKMERGFKMEQQEDCC